MAHWLQNLYLPLLLSEAPPAALEFALDERGRLPPEEGSRGTLTNDHHFGFGRGPGSASWISARAVH